jgi:hypothetical protein
MDPWHPRVSPSLCWRGRWFPVGASRGDAGRLVGIRGPSPDRDREVRAASLSPVRTVKVGGLNGWFGAKEAELTAIVAKGIAGAKEVAFTWSEDCALRTDGTPGRSSADRAGGAVVRIERRLLARWRRLRRVLGNQPGRRLPRVLRAGFVSARPLLPNQQGTHTVEPLTECWSYWPLSQVS